MGGATTHDAWNDPPRATDPEVNIPPDVVDLDQLATAEAAYLQAVREQLASRAPGGHGSGGSAGLLLARGGMVVG